METTTAADGVRLAYRVRGRGEPDVLLIHGWMTTGAVFDELVTALGEDAGRFAIPDLRGCGASEQPASGYTLERFAEDSWRVAEAAGLEAPVVVGHSMGGQIAQLVAAAHADAIRGLVLINPVPASGLPLPDDARGLFQASAEDRSQQGTILDIACKELSPEGRQTLVEAAASVGSACLLEALDAWTDGGFADRLSAITAPTLVIGSDDDFLPSELLRTEVVDRIRGARFAHVPGPGHYPQVERPREVARLVREHLEQATQAA